MFRIDTSKTCIEITICIKENQRIDKIKQGSTSRNKTNKKISGTQRNANLIYSVNAPFLFFLFFSFSLFSFFVLLRCKLRKLDLPNILS